MSRILAYTAVLGRNGDQVRPPLCPVSAEVDFLAFATAAAVPPPWSRGRTVHPSGLDPRRAARWHKLMIHRIKPGYDYYVWTDACLQWRVDPAELVRRLEESKVPLLTFKHPQRRCIYTEMEACVRLGKDLRRVMDHQVDKYRRSGYPADAGLAETACVVRRNDAATRAFAEAWWLEIARGSCRDQLSFPVVAKKTATAWAELPGCRDRSDFFFYYPHISRRKA